MLSPWLQDEEEFDVQISKEGEDLGVDVHASGALLICDIKCGPVSEWNLDNPERPVQPGDRVVEVNGQRGDTDELIAVLRRDKHLNIRLRRLNRFRVTLTNFPGRLGIEIKGLDSSVKVLSINEGAVQEWNQEARSDLQVRPGDRIVAVHGERGAFPRLVQAIKATSPGSNMELTLVRGTSAALPPRGSSTRQEVAQGALQEHRERSRKLIPRDQKVRKESPPPTSPVRSRSGHVIIQVG